MYGCESWTVKKAECRRIDAFELWCWRRLLRVPWTTRRSNQFILREIRPGCSLEGLMLRLKLQYFVHLMQRADSLEKTLMLGGIEGRRRRGRQRMRWLDASLTPWTWVCVNSGSWWWIGRPGVLRFMGSHRVGHDWATELNWTDWQAHFPVFWSSYNFPFRFLKLFFKSIFFLIYNFSETTEPWFSEPVLFLLVIPTEVYVFHNLSLH